MSTIQNQNTTPSNTKPPPAIKLSCKGWIQEAALRMLLNNLDPEVAERPDDLIVYGGRGKAARNFEALDNIITALKILENDESLLIQSGKPVGILKTHKDAPRVLISNSQLVPNWANWKHFDELEKKGLMMYGQMTAGSWIYIGSRELCKALMKLMRHAITFCRTIEFQISDGRRFIERNIECNCRSWVAWVAHNH